MKIVLAIDDSWSRYETLYQILAAQDIALIVTDNPDYIEIVMTGPGVVGVCLDHDMPGRDPFRITQESLCPRSVPVVIVSTNYDGARRLNDLLTEYGVPAWRCPAGSLEWAPRVRDYFLTSISRSEHE